jgi:hypothetical protein
MLPDPNLTLFLIVDFVFLEVESYMLKMQVECKVSVTIFIHFPVHNIRLIIPYHTHLHMISAFEEHRYANTHEPLRIDACRTQLHTSKPFVHYKLAGAPDTMYRLITANPLFQL